MIDTKHLRDLIRRAVPLPWALATSNSYRRIVRADRYEDVCSPVTMPDGHPDLWFRDGFEGPNAQLLLGAVNALPELLDRADRVEALNVIVQSVAAALARHGVTDADDPGEAIDVLVADKDREIARLREAQAWRPIETAPKDGSTVVLRSRGGHIADGYWLQAAFNGCGAWIWPYVRSEPAHWAPLPAAPALQESSHG